MLYHFGIQVAFRNCVFEWVIVCVPFLQLLYVFIRSQQEGAVLLWLHLLFLWLVGQHKDVEVCRFHNVVGVGFGFADDVFILLKILWTNLQACSLEVWLQVLGSAVVRPQTQGPIVAGQDNGWGAVGINDGVHGVANSNQIGCNGEGYLLAFVNEGDSFTWGNVDVTAAAPNDVQGLDRRFYENLRVITADDFQVLSSTLHFLLDCYTET